MEPELCYVLDAVLFLYGIVLTVLYCRLKVGTMATAPPFWGWTHPQRDPQTSVGFFSPPHPRGLFFWGGLGLTPLCPRSSWLAEHRRVPPKGPRR